MRAFLDFLVSNFSVYFESGSEIFLWFFNRAVAASWLILAVVVLRLLLKKAPKWITCALWGICALRLVLPFSLQSVLSLIPSAQTVVPESIYTQSPQIDSGIPAIDNNVNEYFVQGTMPIVPDSAPETIITNEPTAAFNLVSVLFIVWVIGILALLIYAVVSYVKLKRCVKGASMLEKGVFESAGVSSPFILGIFNPKIYLPLNMDEETKTYVLSHERAHLSRGDHILKLLGFVILSLYWFSPLVWVAYILFCRDIELACDEKVVSKLEKNSRADYAQALLSCATQKRTFSACPIAFGEVSIKDRVKSALNYKKPMLWVIIAAVITTVAVAVCFLTDPIKSIQAGTDPDKDNTSSSITSSDISKDETSSLPAISDEDDTSSESEESSKPTSINPPVSSKEEKPTSSKENTTSEPSLTKPVILYYMPENNPAPVSIIGDSAAIPTPVSYTDSPVGENVDYRSTRITVQGNTSVAPIHVVTIRTYDELCNMYKMDSSDQSWEGEDYTKMYSEDYFENTVLFMLLSYKDNVDGEIGTVQLTKRNGQLCIHRKLIRQGEVVGAQYYREFIKVPKFELEDVNSIVLYYDMSNLLKERLPYDVAKYEMSCSGEEGRKIFKDKSERLTGFTKFPIVRIESRDELLKFANEIRPYFDFDRSTKYGKCFNDLLNTYDKYFFDKKTLYMMYTITGSTAQSYPVMEVGKNGNTLSVDIGDDYGGIGATVESTFIQTIEIDKESSKSTIAIDITLNDVTEWRE